MSVAARFTVFPGIIFLMFNAQVASANCRLYLAQGPGFSLSLKTPKNSGTPCQVNQMYLQLSVGSKNLQIKPGSSWQLDGGIYTVTAKLTNSGIGKTATPQSLILASSSATLGSASATAVYTPASGVIAASYEEDSPGATPDYVIRQTSLSLSGMQNLQLRPNGGIEIPFQLIDLSQGQAPWFTTIPAVVDNSPGSTTVVARFLLGTAYPIYFQPYIDSFGQAIEASWTGKVSSSNDLTATIAAEQTWLKQHKGVSNVDRFGGFTGGWTATAKGYYYVDTHNNRWFLISPLGNPLFYLGVTSVDAYSTPLATYNRGKFFTWFPPSTPSGDPGLNYLFNFFRTAWSADFTAFSFATANQLQKYCIGDETFCTLPVSPPPRPACPNSPCTLAQLSADLEAVRFASWAFSGEGKFFSQARLVNTSELARPAFPVLEHDASKLPKNFPAVTNLVSHPDPFDSQTLHDLDATLTKQIGSHATDPYVVGWSVGNEKDEIIDLSEIATILTKKAGTVPAKQSLMLYGLNVLHQGKTSELKNAWGITTSLKTLQDLYDAIPDLATMAANAPNDMEQLREFYEDTYYKLLHDRVQIADNYHHLYFGSWILPGDKTLTSDWQIAVKYCDVVGFDDFTP